MSHSVTITRTTTSMTNTSYIVLNTGYMKSFSGLLKLFELLIGGAMVGLIAYYYTRYPNFFGRTSPDLFLFLMSTTFMIATFCLLLSCLVSISTGSIVAKTIYELIYHSVAAILLLASSVYMIIELSNRYKGSREYDAYMAAGIMGLVNCVLYFISAFLAHRSYRGI